MQPVSAYRVVATILPYLSTRTEKALAIYLRGDRIDVGSIFFSNAKGWNMAGYWTYDEYEGTGVHRMYQSPWMVRSAVLHGNKHVVRGTPDAVEVTVAAFSTKEKAEKFVADGAGGWGTANVWIENWNEDDDDDVVDLSTTPE